MTTEMQPSALPAQNPETVEQPLMSACTTAVSDCSTAAETVVQQPASEATAGVTLMSLAEFKQISRAELTSYGCCEQRYHGTAAVAVPYYDEQGAVVAMRYRTALHKDGDGSDNRFRWRSGDKARYLYGVNRLGVAGRLGWLLIVEGESDCWTGWHYGLPLVGVPGKATWRTEMANGLAGLTVYIWQEPEAEDFTERIGRDVPDARVIVAPEAVKDISAAHLAGSDVVALLRDLRAAAPTYDELCARRRDAELPELYQAARPFFESENPLAMVRAALQAQGYGGNLDVPLIVYLALTGRVLAMRPGAMPAHLLLVGPSGAGKSYALGTALKLLPAVAYHTIDAGSARVMIYDDADLQHRVVIFSEADSLPHAEAEEENPAASAVRNLLQDHHLHYQVVERERESGSFSVREIDKPGPTTLVTTSTHHLAAQLDTRVFTLDVPDDHAQTSQALRTQAALELAGGVPAVAPELLAAQEYLQARAPIDVSVPFADRIATHLAAQPLETRVVRDFARLLSLIKAVTLLNQAQRRRDEQSRIVATLADYGAVYDLVAELYRASASGASQRIRELVSAVAAHLEQGHRSATQADIAAALELSKASVSRRVNAALRGEWLVNEEERKGYPAQLKLGAALPCEYGLPTVDELQRSSSATCCTTVSAPVEQSQNDVMQAESVDCSPVSAFPPGSEEEGTSRSQESFLDAVVVEI